MNDSGNSVSQEDDREQIPDLCYLLHNMSAPASRAELAALYHPNPPRYLDENEIAEVVEVIRHGRFYIPPSAQPYKGRYRVGVGIALLGRLVDDPVYGRGRERELVGHLACYLLMRDGWIPLPRIGDGIEPSDVACGRVGKVLRRERI